MAQFPTSIPSYTGFTSSHTLAADSHAAQHNAEQGDIAAIATKVGTGSSTPTSGKLLRGTGVGASSWAQADLTTDVTGVLPQANGGTGTTGSTGTGSAVYQTSPTIVTPTIADFTNSQHNHQNAAGGGTLNAASALQAASITLGLLGTDSSWSWIDYSNISTIVGWSSFTNKVIRYIQIGKTVYVNFTLTGTSNSANITFTVPVAAKSNSGFSTEMASGLNQDNGAIVTSPARVYIDPSTNTSLVNVVKNMGATGWTTSGTKDVRGVYVYEAA